MAISSALQSLHRRTTTKSSKESFDASSSIWQDTSYWYKQDLRLNTRARRTFTILASLLYLVAFVFLILIELGSTRKTKVLGDIYFFRLSLADIIPTSVQNAQLVNSIARGLGLHDYYQPGLWNYCEGYNDEGITFCSKPKSYYWFNPVNIILNELLSGATIALPSEITQILGILKICSNIMFAFFLAGTVVSFSMIFLSPLAIFSRWWAIPMALVSFLTFLIILIASVIASVISFVFKYAATAQSSLNIHASVGTRMFVFMWIATGCAFFAFILHAGMGCCCTSRRDLKTGRKPMRHSSMKRAQSQRSQRSQNSQNSQMSQLSHSRGPSTSHALPGHNRSNTAFSFEQPTGRGRSGTLPTHDENGVSRSNTVSSNNSGSGSNTAADVSRSNTVRSNKGQVSRSNSGSKQQQGAGSRSRSNTLRSIRFDDERPPSYDSGMTVVDERQEGHPTHHIGTAS
ncbi:SUR7 family protein pun1 [Cytospora mali]|uniref:SUR7 family protein pun1 n=1 Tax=Cytospora mali TaxID=578113 RepID=A0A194WDA9_CYTMA|nr:SUR7 family protein pun1 [Valsa mali]